MRAYLISSLTGLLMFFTAINAKALETSNLRIAGSWSLPASQMIGIKGEVLTLRNDDSASVTVKCYSLSNPLSPDMANEFRRSYRRNVFADENQPAYLIRPSISMVSEDNMIFSTFESGHTQNMTIGYDWNVEVIGTNGQRHVAFSDGTTHPVGYDFRYPGEVGAFENYALITGGEFETRLVNLNTNRTEIFGFHSHIHSVDFTNDQLIVADSYDYAELPGILNFYNFARPDSIHLVRSFHDNHVGYSIVRYGDILYESVSEDEVERVRLLDISDLQNVTVLGYLEDDFPRPVYLHGELLLCRNITEPYGLAFYDISDPEHPEIVASCSGAPLTPYVLAEGRVLAYAYTENRVYVLDRIGLGIEDEAKLIPNSISLSTYPNPFNSTLFINYSIPLSAASNLRIFNQSGQTMLTAPVGQNGTYQWNAAGIPSGLYFIELNSGQSLVTRPVTLLK